MLKGWDLYFEAVIFNMLNDRVSTKAILDGGGLWPFSA